MSVIILSVLILFFIKLYQHYTYWKKRNVPTITRLFASIINYYWRNESGFHMVRSMYEETAPLRYFGTFSPISPSLFVRDPDLIKQITTTHFENFSERDSFFNAESDKILKLGLIDVKDIEEWRKTRKIVSPFFSLHKLKLMHQAVQPKIQQMLDCLEKGSTIQHVNAKDLIGRIISDTTAASLCALNYNSFLQKENEFYELVTSLFSPTFPNLKSLFTLALPKLAKFLKVTVISKELTQFFFDCTQNWSNLPRKQDNNFNQSDLINILIDLREKYKKENDIELVETLTDNFIAGQGVSLFIGLSTTSTFTLCFLMYELAMNPDVQEKLIIEIDKTIANNHGNDLTYTDFSNMKYLNNVINESLRKWPPVFTLAKKCTKNYIISPMLKSETEVVIEKGTMVNIPVIGIHRDPEYYPNPEKFDPDRFDKSSPNYRMVSGSYLPFGLGPRICIGQRYGILHIQIILTALLRKYKIVKVEKTKLEIAFSMTTEMTDNLWVGLIKRTE